MAEKIAIRDAYGKALLELGKRNEKIVALDADVGGSTKSTLFGKEFPDLIDEIKLERQMPLLIEIPDRHGTGRKKDFITSYVNEAIGLKL